MEPVSQSVRIVLLAIFSGVLLEAIASSSATPIQTVAADLDYALEVYLEANGGALPESWDDVDRLLLSLESGNFTGGNRSRLFSNIEGILGGSLQTEFPMFSEREINVEAAKDSQFRSSGKLVAVVADTVIEGRRGAPGRYAIILTETNEIKHGWVDESHLQNQFDEAGETLPAGTPRVQPETFGEELHRVGRTFAEKNFADPRNPTESELEAMRAHFKEASSEQEDEVAVSNDSKPPENAFIPKDAGDQMIEAGSALRDENVGGTIWPYVMVVVALIGIVVVLIRSRKGSSDC
jgi:hypothetical protein